MGRIQNWFFEKINKVDKSDDIANGIVFLISFLIWSLLVYRNETDGEC